MAHRYLHTTITMYIWVVSYIRVANNQCIVAHVSRLCPKHFLKSCCMLISGTKCINTLVVFHPDWNARCQQSSDQKHWYHPVPRASGSVLYFSPTGLWQLHACTLAEVKAVTSEGTVKSQPVLDNVGVLPTITQMLSISWASIPLTLFQHGLNLECYPHPLETFHDTERENQINWILFFPPSDHLNLVTCPVLI